MKIRTFTNPEEWIKASLAVIEKADTIALAGGKTPEPIYSKINQKDKIFFQTDERYVPAGHPDSNRTMIGKYIRNLHAFDTSLPIEQCLEKYERELADLTGDAAFDLVILGIGTDGHIASLFPNSPALHEIERRVAHTVTGEFPVRDRLTITLKPILNSKQILILSQGTEKTKILDELEHSKKSADELPAKALLKHQNLTIHHLK